MIPKPAARVRILYGRPFEVAPGEDGLAAGLADAEARLREIVGRVSHEPTGRHAPRHALAVDQPPARRAAGAAGAAAGVGTLASRHGPAPPGLSARLDPDPRPAAALGRGRQPDGRRIGQDADRHLDRATLRGARPRPGYPAPGLRRRRDPRAPARRSRGGRGGRSRPRGRRGTRAGQRRAGAGAGRRLPAARRPPGPQHPGHERRDHPRGALAAAGGSVAGRLVGARPRRCRHRDPEARHGRSGPRRWPPSSRPGSAARWPWPTSASARWRGW